MEITIFLSYFIICFIGQCLFWRIVMSNSSYKLNPSDPNDMEILTVSLFFSSLLFPIFLIMSVIYLLVFYKGKNK
jgi:hypothetical protein